MTPNMEALQSAQKTVYTFRFRQNFPAKPARFYALRIRSLANHPTVVQHIPARHVKSGVLGGERRQH